MNELSVVQKAREFINAVAPRTVPVPIKEYVITSVPLFARRTI